MNATAALSFSFAAAYRFASRTLAAAKVVGEEKEAAARDVKLGRGAANAGAAGPRSMAATPALL